MLDLSNLSRTDVALIVGGAGKIFIEIADSMPPPDPKAGYLVRWAYGFCQKLASNGMKAEAVRGGGSVLLVSPSSEIVAPAVITPPGAVTPEKP